MENEVKEPAPIYNRITPDDYLAMERAAEIKHEYFDGHIMAMSGARLKHLQIASNLHAAIAPFLKEKNCRMFLADMRVATPGRDGYFYPDASIICGEPVCEDEMFDTLLNPKVIFEILSKSTKKVDMTYKFTYYQQIPSLQEYIMIDSLSRAIYIATRKPNNKWEMKDLVQGKDLEIKSVKYKMSWDEVYHLTGLT